MDGFCKVVKHDFNRLIWLQFYECDYKVESSHKTVVAPYHSLVGNFLKMKLQEHDSADRKVHWQYMM